MKITYISLASDGVIKTRFNGPNNPLVAIQTDHLPVVFMLYSLVDLLPQMLPGSRNVGHIFIQDVLLGADAVILNVLRPVQLAHIKVKCLQDRKDG